MQILGHKKIRKCLIFPKSYTVKFSITNILRYRKLPDIRYTEFVHIVTQMVDTYTEIHEQKPKKLLNENAMQLWRQFWGCSLPVIAYSRPQTKNEDAP